MFQIEPYQPVLRAESRSSQLLKHSNFSHELGNLIQVASSAMNIIARSSGVKTDADLEPVLSGARTSLDRAGVLVRQALLHTNDAEAGLEVVEVEHCLMDVGRVVQHIWPPEIGVSLSLQPDLPGVCCDPLALHNAILNLALNARAAMPKGGEIVIAAETVTADDGTPSVQISVCDTGFGMNADTASRACDPFFTTKSEGLGGLGLSIVEHFVLELGGTIDIDSTPGVGTTVVLQLPAVS